MSTPAALQSTAPVIQILTHQDILEHKLQPWFPLSEDLATVDTKFECLGGEHCNSDYERNQIVLNDGDGKEETIPACNQSQSLPHQEKVAEISARSKKVQSFFANNGFAPDQYKPLFNGSLPLQWYSAYFLNNTNPALMTVRGVTANWNGSATNKIRVRESKDSFTLDLISVLPQVQIMPSQELGPSKKIDQKDTLIDKPSLPKRSGIYYAEVVTTYTVTNNKIILQEIKQTINDQGVIPYVLDFTAAKLAEKKQRLDQFLADSRIVEYQKFLDKMPPEIAKKYLGLMYDHSRLLFFKDVDPEDYEKLIAFIFDNNLYLTIIKRVLEDIPKFDFSQISNFINKLPDVDVLLDKALTGLAMLRHDMDFDKLQKVIENISNYAAVKNPGDIKLIDRLVNLQVVAKILRRMSDVEPKQTADQIVSVLCEQNPEKALLQAYPNHTALLSLGEFKKLPVLQNDICDIEKILLGDMSAMSLVRINVIFSNYAEVKTRILYSTGARQKLLDRINTPGKYLGVGFLGWRFIGQVLGFNSMYEKDDTKELYKLKSAVHEAAVGFIKGILKNYQGTEKKQDSELRLLFLQLDVSRVVDIIPSIKSLSEQYYGQIFSLIGSTNCMDLYRSFRKAWKQRLKYKAQRPSPLVVPMISNAEIPLSPQSDRSRSGSGSGSDGESRSPVSSIASTVTMETSPDLTNATVKRQKVEQQSVMVKNLTKSDGKVRRNRSNDVIFARHAQKLCRDRYSFYSNRYGSPVIDSQSKSIAPQASA